MIRIGHVPLTRHARLLMATSLVGVVLLGGTSGCRDRRIESYAIPKDTRGAATADRAGHPHADVAPAATTAEPGSRLTWQAPAHWKAKPASELRRASFRVPLADGTEGDLSVIVIGGDAGGVPANVNRWRAQLGLPELDADEISRLAETVPAGGVAFRLFDLAGTANGRETRMLAAVAEFAGQSWFIKLTGHDHCVGVEKPAFVAFLRSIQTH